MTQCSSAKPAIAEFSEASAKTLLDTAVDNSSGPEQAYYQRLEQQFASTR